jgi:hypothetical protein
MSQPIAEYNFIHSTTLSIVISPQNSQNITSDSSEFPNSRQINIIVVKSVREILSVISDGKSSSFGWIPSHL